MLKVMNVVTGEMKEVETKKEVAKFIQESNVTDNSIKTIEKKVSKHEVDSDKKLYDTFTIESKQIEGNEEEMNEEIKNEEIVENEVMEESSDELETPGVEIIDETQDVEDEPSEGDKEIKPENKEKPQEEEKPKTAGRSAGIGIEFYLNDELQETFPSIQATARSLKEMLNRDTMPYTIVHKSVRDHLDYTHTDGQTYKFRFVNEGDRKEEYKTRTSKSNSSRGAGKLVDWFINGEFQKQFPSIKAAVEGLKTYMKFSHNPYSAVLKSLNENIDFNQHSFVYATEVREDVKQDASEEVVEVQQEDNNEIVEINETSVELNEEETQEQQ